MCKLDDPDATAGKLLLTASDPLPVDGEVEDLTQATDVAASLSGAYSDLCRAAHKGDQMRVLHLLKRGANVNAAQLPRRLTVSGQAR